ncbi:MAG: fumarate hydratase [Lachnospiraceae bacterium]|nr:fumarate hydratase [Lachnospiraceae bacterium]
MRTIDVRTIADAIAGMCIEANLSLTPDMLAALEGAEKSETSELGANIMGQLKENLKIAGEESIPICQDTGMAVVFVKAGQDVHFEGGSLKDAINEGVRRGYTDGYLRKSVVSDPLLRENTDDNTPAIIHYEITEGDKVELTVAPKGFGSENMSRVFMLKPAEGIDGVKNAVITAVKDAGANACPPMVVGVGIGGDFEKCALLAKKALTNGLNSVHSYYEDSSEFKDTTGAKSGRTQPDTGYLEELRKELFTALNATGIGPGGMGGKNTVLGVNIETWPTHIAGLPVAINICCHVNRHVKRTL